MIVTRPTLSGIIGPSTALPCSQLPGINTSGLLFDHVGACITGSDGDQISTWTDSSAAADNLTGVASPTKPLLKVNIINGRSVARFDGGGYFTLGTAVNTQAFTYVAVVKCDERSVIRPFMGGASGSIEIRVDTNGKVTVLKSGVAGIGTSTTALATTTVYTVGVTYSSPNLAFYLNGSADGTASSAQTFTATTTAIGHSSVDGTSWHGDFAEELMWSSVLSGGDLTTVFNALRTRYAHY